MIWYHINALALAALRTCKESPSTEATLHYLKIDLLISFTYATMLLINEAHLYYVTSVHYSSIINTKLIDGLIHAPHDTFSELRQSDIATAFYRSAWSIRRFLPVLILMQVSNTTYMVNFMLSAWRIAPATFLVLPFAIYGLHLVTTFVMPTSRALDQ
ncbi:hypothetical protein FBU59_004564, partial [Linderina macrospora]